MALTDPTAAGISAISYPITRPDAGRLSNGLEAQAISSGGQRRHAQRPDYARHVGAARSHTAFNQSFCMSRAELRKRAIITEVNIIGTAFLRNDLLPETGHSDIRQLLYDHACSRCITPGSIRKLEELQGVVDRSVKVQQ